MENASKALIIAGAILLSILIISLGIIVYNQAKGTVGNVNLSEHEIAAFNQKFSMYEGNRKSGAQVNALIEAVISSNTQESRDKTGKYVKITYPGNDNATEPDNDVCEVSESDELKNDETCTTVYAGKTYNVLMTKDANTALISEITVTLVE